MDTDSHMTVVAANLAEPQVYSACQLSIAAWKALGYRDVGRIDTRFDRMGDAGLPCLLGVNPIPRIIPDVRSHRDQQRFLVRAIFERSQQQCSEVRRAQRSEMTATRMGTASYLSLSSLDALNGRRTTCGLRMRCPSISPV